ncbi:MAG: redoxin domain-containing protein [Chitinophagales bacterium]|nr:redoxin domain-containing protein [Chitinophagales bacterium]
MKKIWIVAVFISLFSCKQGKDVSNEHTQVKAPTHPTSVYDFTMKTLYGEDKKLSDFKGKVLVIVNTASKCGLTPQYAEIEAFYNNYKDKGVEVLGFPANNFLWQEPGTDDEIAKFCEENYGVSFTMFSKISVKGKDIDPLYSYLTKKENNGVLDADVSWNFQKFVIDRNGKLITFFTPKTTVTSPEFLKTIDGLL